MELISTREAFERIQAVRLPYALEKRKLTDATGCILGEDMAAGTDLPPFDRVAMDGIAIRWEEVDKGRRSFRMQSRQAAGEKPHTLSDEGYAIEVMTGGVLPEGADAVVRYEDLDIADGVAAIKPDVKVSEGQNVHRKGSDRPEGSLLVAAGSLITPPVIGIASSQGWTKVKCRTLPAVSVLSTGDELVPVSKTPRPHQIRMSNPYLIHSALQSFGAEAVRDHMPDDRKRMRRILKKHLKRSDILVVTGAVSMGKFDFLPEVLASLGIEEAFHGVRQRPGKPFWFGRGEGKVVFGFPGNPVSAAACTAYYLIPYLKAVLGMEESSQYKVCTLADDVSFAPPMTRLMPVTLYDGMDGMCYAVPVEGNGSGDYAGIGGIHGFAELEADMARFPKGMLVRVFPLV
jgi:molybdopterin molybdotransferase